jgi:hypothetical protein
MPGNVQIFWVERAGIAELSYRRLVFDSTPDRPKCTGKFGYHNAIVVIGDVPWVEQEYRGKGVYPTEEEKKDPRWPTHCDCGYMFQDGDSWYVDYSEYLRNPANGEIYQLHKNTPPGATFDASWIGREDPGPDGKGLCVILPDGAHWCMDAKLHDGTGWTRSGSFPTVTVSPSIRTSHYHGFLRNGVLEPCSDSQT